MPAATRARLAGVTRWIAFVVTLALVGGANAHEQPRGRDLIVDGDLIVLNVNRGLVISEDGGDSWNLYCGEAFGVNSNEQAPMRLLSDKRLMLATSGGVQRSTTDFCDWTVSDVPAAGTLALSSHPSEAATTLVSTGTETPLQGIYRTTDEGERFTRVGELPMYGFFGGGLAHAPSDGTRVYGAMQGVNQAGDGIAFFMGVSNDGGDSFDFHAVPMDTEQQRGLRVLGVHPGDADTVYASIDGIPEVMRDDQLVVSSDGGQSFSTLLEVSALRAFALAPDGSGLWVSGEDGMWRSDDGGQSFEQLIDGLMVSCLLHDGQQLWACVDSAMGFARLVRSDDGGQSLQQVMMFTDVTEKVACPDGTDVADTCDEAWEDWDRELINPPDDADGGLPDGGDASVAPDGGDGSGGDRRDAGSDAGGPASAGADSGCGCATLGARSHRGAPCLAWLAAALLFCRRRR